MGTDGVCLVTPWDMSEAGRSTFMTGRTKRGPWERRGDECWGFVGLVMLLSRSVRWAMLACNLSSQSSVRTASMSIGSGAGFPRYSRKILSARFSLTANPTA